MKKIPLLASDEDKALDDILARKKNAKSNPKRLPKKVKNAYASFLAMVPNLESAVPLKLGASAKTFLRSTYSSQKSNLRARIIANLPSKDQCECPYCRIGETDTLDHFLPKEDYAEFSIFSSNLIPVCGRCNTIKSKKLAEKGQRLFYNSYFDSEIKGKLLWCCLSKRGKMFSAHYFVKQPRVMTSYTFRVIEKHFEHLNLGDRYKKKVAHHLAIYYVQAHKWLSDGKPFGQLRVLFKNDFRRCISLYGLNHWESAFYYALLKCPESFFL